MQVPEDVVKEMKQLAEDVGESFDNIKGEFKKVFEEKYLESFENDERCRQAAFIVKARRVSSLRSGGDWYEGKFVSVGRATVKSSVDKKTKEAREFTVGTSYAIMAKSDAKDSKVMLAEVTFFDDACKILSEGLIDTEKCYKIKLSGEEKDGILKLRASGRPAIQEIKLDIPPARDIIPQVMSVIPLAEASMHASASFGSKPKLIRGRVLSARVNTTKKSGKPLGFYNITDDSISVSAFTAGNAKDFTVMCGPELVLYDAGSDVYFLGRISPETEEYSSTMWADAVIPILGIPLEHGISDAMLNDVLPPGEADNTLDMSDFGEDDDI